ncbi:MAG TPA: threonine synthase [Anaerolineae bacterium]|nr:threonine synthase [Anaerolineae bacterium]HMR62834.1 threonine synthase [Anaerolineae bacterium]
MTIVYPVADKTSSISLRSLDGSETYPAADVRYLSDSGQLLDVWHDLEALRSQVSRALFDGRRRGAPGPTIDPLTDSGVWRYRELILPVPVETIVTRPEGNTPLYEHPCLGSWVGVDGFYLKHEGENPTGSFKDRGMTVGVTQAKAIGARAVACASTGNTSASMAAYAAKAGMAAFIFIPAGKIAAGKLSQALAYGAHTLQIRGDFDDAMRLVQQVCNELGIYLLNSLNPFRLEGQKSIVFEILQGFGWQPPDWIVLPGGNLGNTAAFGKALYEARELGLIDRLPRIATIQAEGASPFYQSFSLNFAERKRLKAQTIATAIRIGDPVSFERAVRTFKWTDGVSASVTDEEIMNAKALVDSTGIGCEPASAASVAGARKLVSAGVIRPDETVVGILTGNLLKDPTATVDYHTGAWPNADFANHPLELEATLAAVQAEIEKRL